MRDKWGRRIFTAGGVFLIVIGLVHSISLFTKQVPDNETERQLLDLMGNYRFNLMGSLRSMAELMRGFSTAFMLSAIGVGALDLLLARERPQLLKRVALINTIWLAVMAANSLIYFFIVPTSFLSAAILIFALAWLKLPATPSSPVL
jgi:hypothetical protein